MLAKLGLGAAAGMGTSAIVNSVFPNKWASIGGGALASYSAGGMLGAVGYLLTSGALSQFGLLGSSNGASGGAV